MSLRLVIRNRSGYPSQEVRELVKFAVAEIDMRGVCVNVKNARSAPFRGMAYMGVPYVSDAPPSSEYLVTIGIGDESRFPLEREHGPKTAEKFEMRDWREALVVVAAHEAKHIEQFKEGLSRSEVACERFSLSVLRRYRERVA